MKLIPILVLACIQGLAELLPVSSSAHVIVAEKLMGLDPSSPDMTFLLVMLHTGTMFAVLLYFWPRWKVYLTSNERVPFLKTIVIATFFTGVLGVGFKIGLKKFGHMEVEHLFRNLPLISASLFLVGLVIIYSGRVTKKAAQKTHLEPRTAVHIGVIQGLCLPFRGFSRSGATISTALLNGVSKNLAEDFSFALAVVLTPPVIFLELHRLMKNSHQVAAGSSPVSMHLTQGLIGMFFSFVAGLAALRWLSSWLEKGNWKYFGYYCLVASCFVFATAILMK